MPTNDYGGGSTSSVCAITPADERAYFDNIAERLTRIETILSQLLGSDVTAIQLSDITQDMGTILGGTLGGGVLAQLSTLVSRVNAWGLSGNAWITSGGVNGSTGDMTTYTDEFTGTIVIGTAKKYQTNLSVNNCSGVQAASPLYRPGGGSKRFLNSGFLFEARVGLGLPMSAPNDMSKVRFFCGLHNANFVASGTLFNNDNVATTDDTGYVGFQFSGPRGDNTFKVITRGEAVILGPATGVIYETGVPLVHDTLYEFTLRCEPGSETVTWTIKNMQTGASSTGTAGMPQNYEDPITGFPTLSGYSPGAAIWNNTTVQYQVMYINHIWTQTLDVDTP